MCAHSWTWNQTPTKWTKLSMKYTKRWISKLSARQSWTMLCRNRIKSMRHFVQRTARQGGCGRAESCRMDLPFLGKYRPLTLVLKTSFGMKTNPWSWLSLQVFTKSTLVSLVLNSQQYKCWSTGSLFYQQLIAAATSSTTLLVNWSRLVSSIHKVIWQGLLWLILLPCLHGLGYHSLIVVIRSVKDSLVLENYE